MWNEATSYGVDEAGRGGQMMLDAGEEETARAREIYFKAGSVVGFVVKEAKVGGACWLSAASIAAE